MATSKKVGLRILNGIGMRLERGRRTVHLLRCTRQIPGVRSVSDDALKKSFPDVGHSLRSKIRATGPVTVAQYMREVLTAPLTGYYMSGDVFGAKGDFVTSPEISQIFGELLAIWCIDQWNKMGRPAPLQVVELGPGRGTLADDMLRVHDYLLQEFPDFKDHLSLHLVELSPALRKIQLQKLCGERFEESSETSSDSVHRDVITKYGFPVSWHLQVTDIPEQFSIYVAHEFFDALPVHKFQKSEHGWSEVLVDVEDNDENRLRFVLSRNPTSATIAYLKGDVHQDHLEISPQSGVLVEELAKRIVEDGGVALIADYGHDGEGGDTFRAFKDHKLHDPLLEPGTADLTADVNFDFLRKRALQHDVITYGPICQRLFLENLGISLRLERLLRNCDEEAASQLKSACDRLVNPVDMGECFKFFSIYPATMKPYLDRFPPSGFF